MDISSGLSLTEPQIKDWHRAIRNGERATLIKYQSRMQCWPFDFAEHRDELFIASLCKRGLPSMRWIAAQIRPSSVVLRAALSRLAHPEFIELIGQNFWPADESTARGHWRYHSVRHILRNHPMGWREGVKNILSAIDAGMPASTTRQYGHGFDLFSDLINTNNKKWNASEAGGVGALSLLLEGISVPEWGSLSEPPMEHVLNTAILAENAEAFFVLLS